MTERVIAVVVSYNRRELVVQTLRALDAQTRPVDRVLVIDNASTDGTAEVVSEDFPTNALVRFEVNTGGAGGFAAGLAHALTELNADLIWLMDDDTIPDSTALENLLRARRVAPAGAALFASAVRWSDGRPHPMNTPRVRPFASKRAVTRARRAGCYPVRSASFVSVLIEADAVLRDGLPIADYFLWNDDFEYTTRLLRHARGYLCTRSTVEHRTRTFGSSDADPGPRFFYEVRNKLWLLRYSASLSLAEKLLYLAVTLSRWSRTFIRSSDRRVLLQGLSAGLRAGTSGRPRSNADVFAGLDEAKRAVQRFDARAVEWTILSARRVIT